MSVFTQFACNSSGTFASDQIPVELLVVGGGGGGLQGYFGYFHGGGAGEVVYYPQYVVTKNTNYTITVGAGGAGRLASTTDASGVAGTQSTFGTIVAGGGGEYGSSPGFDPDAVRNTGGDLTQQGGGFYSLRNPGGYSFPQVLGAAYAGAGGGGAGGAGANAQPYYVSTPATVNYNNGASGGPGVRIGITGSGLVYGGGGGGGAYWQSSTSLGGAGGLGGDGGGGDAGNQQSVSSSTVSGTPGAVNTGGGGGGGAHWVQNTPAIASPGAGGAGGAGVVVVAYPDTYPAPTTISGTYTTPSRTGYRVYRFTGTSSINW